MKHIDECAAVFKALSNEQRLKLFLMIVKDCCPKEGYEKAFTKACECMDLSRSTISHHLKELQSAGLLTAEREGQSFRYRVNYDALKRIRALFE